MASAASGTESGSQSPLPDGTPAGLLTDLEQVRLAIGATPDGAQASSERCFASARDEQSVGRAEMCIVFDEAYLEWNQSAADVLSRPAYFNDAVVRLRHRNAMGAYASFDDAQLMQLRQRTLNALLGEISSKVSTDSRGR